MREGHRLRGSWGWQGQAGRFAHLHQNHSSAEVIPGRNHQKLPKAGSLKPFSPKQKSHFPWKYPRQTPNTSSFLLTNSAMAGMLYYLSNNSDLLFLSQLRNNSWSLEGIFPTFTPCQGALFVVVDTEGN